MTGCVVVTAGNGRKIASPIAFGFMLAGLIIAGVCLLLSVVFSVISWPPYADFLLDKSAVTGNAQILENSRVISTERGTGKPNRVVFRAKLMDQEIGQELKLTAKPTPDYSLGSQVVVEYLKDNSSIVRVQGDSYGIFNYEIILILLGGVLVGFGDVCDGKGEDALVSGFCG